MIEGFLWSNFSFNEKTIQLQCSNIPQSSARKVPLNYQSHGKLASVKTTPLLEQFIPEIQQFNRGRSGIHVRRIWFHYRRYGAKRRIEAKSFGRILPVLSSAISIRKRSLLFLWVLKLKFPVAFRAAEISSCRSGAPAVTNTILTLDLIAMVEGFTAVVVLFCYKRSPEVHYIRIALKDNVIIIRWTAKDGLQTLKPQKSRKTRGAISFP